MTLAATADRMARPMGAGDMVIWLDGDARRYPPRSILRLTRPEGIGHDGDPRPGAPYELVVVLDVHSPFSVHVSRGQFGTERASYPPGSFVDALAMSPLAADRPIYRGFEDVT